jgi:hypothetical protein
MLYRTPQGLHTNRRGIGCAPDVESYVVLLATGTGTVFRTVFRLDRFRKNLDREPGRVQAVVPREFPGSAGDSSEVHFTTTVRGQPLVLAVVLALRHI